VLSHKQFTRTRARGTRLAAFVGFPRARPLLPPQPGLILCAIEIMLRSVRNSRFLAGLRWRDGRSEAAGGIDPLNISGARQHTGTIWLSVSLLWPRSLQTNARTADPFAMGISDSISGRVSSSLNGVVPVKFAGGDRSSPPPDARLRPANPGCAL